MIRHSRRLLRRPTAAIHILGPNLPSPYTKSSPQTVGPELILNGHSVVGCSRAYKAVRKGSEGSWSHRGEEGSGRRRDVLVSLGWEQASESRSCIRVRLGAAGANCDLVQGKAHVV